VFNNILNQDSVAVSLVWTCTV